MLTVFRKSVERRMTELLATAEIRVNGDRPWDMQVRNRRMFSRVFFAGSLGFGEAYTDNWWECEALNQLFFKLVHHQINQRFRRMWRFYILSLAGCFRARFLQVWQVVLSPDGKPVGYTSQR